MATGTITRETMARYALLTADEHYAMQGRAYREAARCWSESRANLDPDARELLRRSAIEASAFYDEVTLALQARTRPEFVA
jgi:hypothetical protein